MRGMLSAEVDAYVRKKMKAIDQATSLAAEGRADEARQVLNDFLATRPGPKLEHDARKALKNIDETWSLQGALSAANELARYGKPDEARKVLNKYLASRPDQISEEEARKALENVDATAQHGVQSVIFDARMAAGFQKTDEARKILNRYLAGKPAKKYEDQARDALKQVDAWAKQGPFRPKR